MAKTDWILQKR